MLEIGATPTADTLLRLPALAAARSRVGIDLTGPHDCGDFAILGGQANAMTMFAARTFDTVLCNSVLEHDPRFWRTLQEVRRVLRPGGLFVVGVPGYGPMGSMPRLPGEPPASTRPEWLAASAPVLGLHDFPGDFYRFSRQAVGKVLLAGFVGRRVEEAMRPPRFLGSGRMPGLDPAAPSTLSGEADGGATRR